MRRLCLTACLILACGPSSHQAHAGSADAGPRAEASDGGDAGSSCSSDDTCGAGLICTDGLCTPGCTAEHACVLGFKCTSGACTSAVLGEMSLYQVTGTTDVDGGPEAVTIMDAVARFHEPVVHDYDDTQQGFGCVADHYDATSKPAPTDADAAFLRIAGFTGGTLLSGQPAAQPILCTPQNGYYQCAYPVGVVASLAPFAAGASPLGAGPIQFDTGSGADFGARSVSATPDGTLSVSDNLTGLQYSAAQDTVLHPSCAGGCASSNFRVRITFIQGASASLGWPYPSVGLATCLFQPGASITVPQGAVAAMAAGDASLDTAITEVVRVSDQTFQAADVNGNPLVGETGEGVFGQAPLAL